MKQGEGDAIHSERSIEQPFRGLPTEIRLLIWEYVALSIIEVTEIQSDDHANPSAHNHDDLELKEDCVPIRFDFSPPLKSLLAITQTSRIGHQEFTAVIHKLGLSFDVALTSANSIDLLVAQLDKSSAPKTRLLRVHGSKDTDLNFEWYTHLVYRSVWRTFGQPVHYKSIQRLEITVDGQMWKADAQTLIPSIDLAAWSRENSILSRNAFLEAARRMCFEFTYSSNSISSHIGERLVIDIVNLDWQMKEAVAHVDEYWRTVVAPSFLGKSSGINFGPLYLDSQASESSGHETYRYQIHLIRKKAGRSRGMM